MLDPTENIGQALVAILKVADDQADMGLSKTALVKFLYLLDVLVSEETGRPWSNADWRFVHFGPFASEIDTAISGLTKKGVRVVSGADVGADRDFTVYRHMVLDVERSDPTEHYVTKFSIQDINPKIHFRERERLPIKKLNLDLTSELMLNKSKRRPCVVLSEASIDKKDLSEMPAQQQNRAIVDRASTVAVLAHGLDSIYPKSNERLATDIVKNGGSLVSEYSYGTRPFAGNFVERDRIQAALSLGVIMVQSAAKGGSLHASKAALRYGRILSVPEPTKEDKASKHPKIEANLWIMNAEDTAREEYLECTPQQLANVFFLRSRADYPILEEKLLSVSPV